MLNPCVLYRKDKSFGDNDSQAVEISAIYKNFPVFQYRSQIPNDSLVIGRYSVMPFYKELQDELKLKNSRLINSYSEHLYIADIMNWYEDVKEFTPKTYTTWGHITGGKWVVKGKTYSRKHHWNSKMFADGKEELLRITRELLDDPMISENGLVVREYVPLKRIDTAPNGLPIVKEWRMFFFKENYLCGGYYWSSHFEEYCEKYGPDVPNEAIEFAKKVAKIVAEKTNFFVLDVAEKENGEFILIEINDGQMSGLSCCNPEELYLNLKKQLDGT